MLCTRHHALSIIGGASIPFPSVFSEKDQEAARWAVQFISALDNKAPEIILADGLDSYHRLPATYCPGVSAIETLLLTLSNNTVNTFNTAQVRIYATNYNVLRIMSGMGGLAYSN